MSERPPRGELTEAIVRILGESPVRETRREHYAHVRGPGRLDVLLGIAAPARGDGRSGRPPRNGKA